MTLLDITLGYLHWRRFLHEVFVDRLASPLVAVSAVLWCLLQSQLDLNAVQAPQPACRRKVGATSRHGPQSHKAD